MVVLCGLCCGACDLLCLYVVVSLCFSVCCACACYVGIALAWCLCVVAMCVYGVLIVLCAECLCVVRCVGCKNLWCVSLAHTRRASNK